MKLSRLFALFAILPAAALLGGLMMIVMADEIAWGYEGNTGPGYWFELAPEFALCGEGKAQSPIDIRDAVETDLVDIDFDYGDAASTVVNNGHTIQVDLAAGSAIVYNGIRYDLLQFHFHAPSEHTIDGEAAPMEIHFVHSDPNSGALAVVGILLMEGEADNAAYASVLDAMPAESGEPQALSSPLALDALLPETEGLLRLPGLADHTALQRNCALALARYAGGIVR